MTNKKLPASSFGKEKTDVTLDDASCPLGCLRHDQTVLTGRDLLHNLPGTFTVVKCIECGLMRTNPRPNPASIGQYYPDEYGPYLSSKVRLNKPAVGRIPNTFKTIFKRIFDFYGEKIPPVAAGRLLEVGCASGSFLYRMASKGWNVRGIEFSSVAAEAASEMGYPVHVGSLETAPEPDAPFDLIVAWMVLEHLHDPVVGLGKLRQWAKPGTWLALSVPNAGSLEFKVFMDKWYALQLPTHLFHYTPKTLELVLYAGGWKLERIYHQRGLGNLIASLGYVLSAKGYERLGRRLIAFAETGGRLNYLFFPVAWLLSFVGQTGRMTVWAKPSPETTHRQLS